MLTLYGTGVAKGITIGRAFVLHRERPEVPEYVLPVHLIEGEVERFQTALADARGQLERVRAHIPDDAPPELGSFLDTHLLIMHDRMIAEAPATLIRRDQVNAEWALRIEAERLAAVFDQMDDPYLRNKKTDVEQVVDRILRNLLRPAEDEHDQISDALAGQIVIANDLTPADTVLLKSNGVAAFVTNLGGPISHTAILAKSLGIPAIIAAHNATRFVRSGEELIVDGKIGAVLVEPDAAILAEYRKRQKDIAFRRRDLDALRSSPAVTRDGIEIGLHANIELPDDMRAVGKSGATGIGLYRTEFLFMNRAEAPGEEEQYIAYAKVVRALAGKPCTIRTLDLGADKRADGGYAAPGTNPALGLRAVRMCLQDAALFSAQLRAILRASALGPVRMMIPMLSNLDEVGQVLDLVADVRKALKREGKAHDEKMPIGGMIEVPAAAVTADLFARRLDFLSIGTNDLIQYTLAIDRVDDAVSYLYDPLHPAVIRLIGMTIRAGRAAGIPVAMCGEMAGDSRFTRLLIGLGLDEFSMHPSALPEIKRIVRESRRDDLAKLAEQALLVHDSLALHEIVDAMNHGSD
jgi:phosphotransferase system enzyme I (PtsI)